MGTGDNVREAQEKRLLKAAEGYICRLGEAVMYIAKHIEDPPDSDTFIKEVRIKVRYGYEGDVLAIIKADRGKDKVVAFQSGDRLDEVVQGLANRLRNGDLKWREDKPYDAERDNGSRS